MLLCMNIDKVEMGSATRDLHLLFSEDCRHDGFPSGLRLAILKRQISRGHAFPSLPRQRQVVHQFHLLLKSFASMKCIAQWH